MKKTTLILVSSALTILTATAAYADDGRGGKHDRMTFETLDANGDGQITADEIAGQKATHFAEMDSDGNGEISLEEFKSKGRRGNDEAHQAAHARMFALLDADNSGGLSQAEIENRRNIDREQMMLVMLDENGDGQISEEEFDAAKGHRRGGRGWH